jgi:3-phosphoshikimate 1-carboxyvinyltransferase
VEVTIQPSDIKGEITAPASKSSMQRACAAALVRKGTSVISNPGISNDDMAALGIIKNLGAEWEIINEELIIKSRGVNPISNEINCGESGLSIRMFTPIVALSGKQITINGNGNLAARPMDFFDEILPLLGVEINSQNGKLPLKRKGPLRPQNVTIDGSLSSQFLTGLLMGYAASDAGGKSITVTNLKSKPYIDLTLKVMEEFGLNVPINRNYESFYFAAKPINQLTNQPINYTVESDWSGAAFLLVAGAIAGEITVKGLDIYSTQADKAILQALIESQAKISSETKQITIAPAKLKAFHFDATDCPDLFPPLVALASYCEGTTVIEGVKRLEHKESNRGLALQEEFKKMGVEIELQNDIMLIKGEDSLRAASIHSHHDHRIAMACAVAALKAKGETIIEEAQAVNKSYPNFYAHLRQLGAIVSVKE